ncbi:putative leader peptide [Embleya sp. NPDC008237]
MPVGPPRLAAMSSPMLVSRRHVDLVRVTSMACRMSH